MSVTIKDIAKEAGVSPATVSKVLNRRGSISYALRRKIEEIARRTGYAPYLNARKSGMYDGATKLIGVIYANAGEQLVKDIQSGIDSVLQAAGFYEIRYTVNVGAHLYSEERRKDFIDKVLEDKAIVGLLSVFLKVSDSYVASLQKNGIPVVLVNNHTDCGKCVVTNNEEATFQATQALLDLGRRRIGLIMPEETQEPLWEQRLAGYKRALAKAGIPYDPYVLVYEHNFTLKDAARATRALLERDPKVDAILYGSDLQAYGGLEALKEMGKRIPDDVAVMGFDDMMFSQISDPPLSSVRQPMHEMGRTAARLLVAAIKKKDFSNEVVELKSTLVLRPSTHKEIPRSRFLS